MWVYGWMCGCVHNLVQHGCGVVIQVRGRCGLWSDMCGCVHNLVHECGTSEGQVWSVVGMCRCVILGDWM